MAGNLRILVVDDDEWVHADFLGRLFKDTLGVDEVECVHASSIDEGFEQFCYLNAKGPIDLMIIDLSLPQTLDDKAGDQRMARSGLEFIRPDYVDKMGGLKLMGLILEYIRLKTGNIDAKINFPTVYLSGWDRKDQHNELIKHYHRSLSFDWICKPIATDELIDRCADLIETYDVCFKRTGLS